MAIPKVFYRAATNYDLDKASDEATVKDFGPSLTVQSHRDDCDLNIIMARVGITGKMPEGVEPLGYGDFTEAVDYASALMAVNRARDAFMTLLPEVRSRFGNDPQAFLEFCSSPGNHDELVRMGLTVKPTEPAAQPASSVSPAPAASAPAAVPAPAST